jgi:hypothetical protein
VSLKTVINELIGVDTVNNDFTKESTHEMKSVTEGLTTFYTVMPTGTSVIEETNSTDTTIAYLKESSLDHKQSILEEEIAHLTTCLEHYLDIVSTTLVYNDPYSSTLSLSTGKMPQERLMVMTSFEEHRQAAGLQVRHSSDNSATDGQDCCIDLSSVRKEESPLKHFNAGATFRQMDSFSDTSSPHPLDDLLINTACSYSPQNESILKLRYHHYSKKGDEDKISAQQVTHRVSMEDRKSLPTSSAVTRSNSFEELSSKQVSYQYYYDSGTKNFESPLSYHID